MAYSEDDVKAAGRAIALRDDQISGLLAVLRARASVPQKAVQPSHEQVRFDLARLLWYAGALIIMGAMSLFTTLAFNMLGGGALAIIGIIYAALFTLGGHVLWHGRNLKTPAGLLVTVAVAMAPLVVFGIQDAMGWWDEAGAPGRYQGFHVWIKSSWLPMEIVTILVGLLALRFYPFSFIVFVIAYALWFMSMDLTPWLFQNDDLNWGARKNVSMAFGLVVMLTAWVVDVKRSKDHDFAFWLHLSGLMAFWGGLTFSSSDSEVAKAIYCLINVGLILLSVFLMRRAYALFGAIGVCLYLGHLASKVFADSLLFPFALSFIGILVIAAGLLLHRYHETLSNWMADHLPDTLKKLRPPHADALRLEHA
ncbi:hypothetical protein [Microvirga arabica]|uniref:hypothetical protein n=1 Tax=Microvirga arabica TaxID=1128671 RepID=UPI00193A677F|nr:hypothetical protein [Microvirga arabica]MBM1171156.1 hypothetical protein [Microvirga arabica]